ncbi:MAG TPA: hypothetical protein VHE77_02760 [Dongiaceae bacterium]|jgi:hypothetical protein|nr:hypothetical protein [Dongiaceae bacterium]
MAYDEDSIRHLRARLRAFRLSIDEFRRTNAMTFRGSMAAISKSRDLLHSTDHLPGMSRATRYRVAADALDFDGRE